MTAPRTAALALRTGALLLGMTGCTVGPNYRAPTPWYSPVSWFGGKSTVDPKVIPRDASQAVAEPVDPSWWTLFHDPELASLEQRLAAANLDVRVSTIRLAESRAQLGVTRADAFPQLNANSSYTREQQSAKGVIALFSGSGSPALGSNGLGGTTAGIPNTSGSASAPFDLYQYGFDASWEVDLWGRVRREVEGAKATVTASEESRRDTLVSALAELARDYVQLRGVQQTIQILQDNAKTAQQSLTLTQDRAAGGLSTDLDVANAAAQLQSTLSDIPTEEAQENQLINAIALLLGQAPNTLTAELQTPNPIPPVPPDVPVGLPSELARRRPDIRRAEAQLHAATADVGVAVADFYPRVTLNGSVAVQSLQFKDLGSWALADTYGIGPSVTLPIFQGARLTRTLDLRKQQQQEAALSYQRTVLGALHDVNNALSSYAAEQGRAAALARAVAQNQRALGLAREQYTAGLSTFLEVLNAERTLLGSQQQLVQSQASESTNLVQLYKALGGGWETDFPEGSPQPKPPVIPVELVEP